MASDERKFREDQNNSPNSYETDLESFWWPVASSLQSYLKTLRMYGFIQKPCGHERGRESFPESLRILFRQACLILKCHFINTEKI